MLSSSSFRGPICVFELLTLSNNSEKRSVLQGANEALIVRFNLLEEKCPIRHFFLAGRKIVSDGVPTKLSAGT